MNHWPSNRLKRHLLFWVGFGLFIAVIPTIGSDFCFCGHVLRELLYEFAILIPTSLLFTYPLAYGLLPLAFRRQFGLFLGGVLLLYATSWFQFDLLVYGLQDVLKQWFSYTPTYPADTWLFSSPFPGASFLPMNITAGLFISLKLFRQWQQKQAENQRLEREKLTQELALLKLQLNPTFLFGTLSTLHTLTQYQPKQAPEVVLKLAQFLRYVLYESQAEAVPLAREIEVISDYVFLQRIIHATLVEVSFTIRGTTDNQRIAPLSLFPIIESTFRQFPAELTEPTWISLDLAVTETQVTLKVINERTHPPTDEANTSTNLNGLRKQLAFYYPNNHSLKTLHEDRINVVTLIISFPTNSAEPKPLSTHPIGSIA